MEQKKVYKMKSNKIKLVIILITASVLLSGCISVDNNFKGVRNKVLSSIDTDFHREVEFGVGAAGLMFSSIVVSFTDAEHYIDDMIRKIDRVQVGVYKQEVPGDVQIDFHQLRKITDELKDSGYNFIVRSIDSDEMVAVMVKNDAEYRLNEMFVVTLNDDELVMAQIFGNLDELIEIVIREEGFKVEMANH